jgi:hypothetical protein
MPREFDKLGIHFLYPDNWTLDEEEALQGNNSVTVQSPGGAFWSITLHPAGLEPDQLAQAALEALQAEYQDAESEPVSEELAGQLASGYDLRFFYLDFVNVAAIRAFHMRHATGLVLCQAEDREYDELRPVFQAITTSLLSPA